MKLTNAARDAIAERIEWLIDEVGRFYGETIELPPDWGAWPPGRQADWLAEYEIDGETILFLLPFQFFENDRDYLDYEE